MINDHGIHVDQISEIFKIEVLTGFFLYPKISNTIAKICCLFSEEYGTNNYLNKIQHRTCCRTIGFFFFSLFFVDQWSDRRKGALKFFGSRIFPYFSLSSEISTMSNISIKLEKLTSTVTLHTLIN